MMQNTIQADVNSLNRDNILCHIDANVARVKLDLDFNFFAPNVHFEFFR